MRIFLMFGTLLGWFALVGQFYLIILNRVTSIVDVIIRYFTFYTILTNLLVALYFTFLLLSPSSKWGKFFSRTTVATALAVYIAVVGLTYNIVLRPLWNPQGLQKVVDELLHSVIPFLYIVYWFLVARKNQLQWKGILPWLIFPLLYLVVILVLGSFSGYYPYPFVDVVNLGYPKVFINCGFVTLAFLFFCFLFVGISKIKT
ncbi:MAG: Pr6Pr family membrane protein [Chryseolinea sp.]